MSEHVRAVQTVLVADSLTLARAREKVRALGYRAGKVHHTGGHWRFRQFDARKVSSGGCRSSKISEHITLVYCDVKPKAPRKAKRTAKRRAKRRTTKRKATSKRPAKRRTAKRKVKRGKK